MPGRSLTNWITIMKTYVLISALLIPTSLVRASEEVAVPEPSLSRINYAQPRDYLVLNDSLGDKERIQKLAATLQGATPEQSLFAIGRWIQANLKYDANAAYAWRNFDVACDSKVYGGCADHAVVFASLARACGIPTVFVKTMDADWIREFRATGSSNSWRGHVFLEVHVGGRWQLLDAQALQLYDDYNPAMRILPGSRYAYDKGADPRELVLSLDWERWKKQTAAYFGRFDLAQLPVGEGRRLGAIYVAANSPVYQAVTRRLQTLGHSDVTSFNMAFEKFLRRAQGGDLVLTCVGGTVVLPKEYHARYLPVADSELTKRMETQPNGVLRKQLDDGTRVVLIYGKDVDSIQAEIDRFQLGVKP
jgi:hypothetical protein